MNISKTVLIIFATLSAILLGILISMGILISINRKMENLESHHFEAYKLALHLLQSSNDLTRMARTYVSTGDPKYERYFDKILSMRDGSHPLPKDQTLAYWDLVTAEMELPPNSSQPSPLIEQMKMAGFTEKELLKMEEAKKMSDELAKLEKLAFGAMKGIFPDPDGNMTLLGAPDPNLAKDYLFGTAYHKAKGAIMKPITELLNDLEQRTNWEIENSKTVQDLFFAITVSLIIATLFIAAFSFYFARLYMVKPITSLAKTAKEVSTGAWIQRPKQVFLAEIEELYTSFFEMLDSWRHQMSKMEQSEHALLASEERYRTLIENSTEAIMVLNVDSGKFHDINNKAMEFFGLSREELLKLSPLDLSPEIQPDGRSSADKAMEHIQDALMGHPNIFEWVHKNSKGEENLFEIHLMGLPHPEKKLVRACMLDISERKKADQKLKASEEKYRVLFDTAMDAIFVAEVESGIIVDCNKSACDLLQRTREEIIGMHQRNLHPVSMPFNEELGVTDSFKKHTDEGNQGVHLKTQIVQKSGALRTVTIKANTFEHMGNTLIQGIFRDVTEMVETVEALEERDSTLSAFLNAITESSMLIDPKGVVYAANETVATRLGTTVANMIGKNAFDFVKEDVRRLRQAKIEESVERKKPIQFEDERSNRSILNSIYPILNSKGEVFRLVIFGYDITERKQAEKALRESERHLRNSQQIAHVGSWRLDIATNQVVWTEELYNMYGFDPSLPPPPYTEHMKLFTPSSWEQLSTSLANTMETGIPYELELETVKKDGSNGWMWVRGEAIKDSEGSTIGLWGAAQDITERKRIEIELRKNAFYLKKAQEMGKIGHFSFDPITGIVESSSELLRIFDLNSDQPLFKSFADAIHPEDGPLVFPYIDRAIKEGIPYDVKHRVLHRNGSVWYVNAKGETLDTDQGRRIVGTIQDITELSQLEKNLASRADELEKLNQKLESKNLELTEFTYVASHDLQEPLRKIVSFSKLLEKDLGEIPERAQTDIHYIVDSALRMQSLIHDLLALSRAGRMDLIREELELDQCVQSALLHLDLLIKETQADITLTHLPKVFGDKNSLVQLFQNLLGNALKFTQKDVPPHIELTIEQGESGPVLGVRDHGIGIPKKFAEEIFKPFKRLHGIQSYQGSGIGLAICKKVVERHFGTIWVDSSEGEGAHFKFTLANIQPDR